MSGGIGRLLELPLEKLHEIIQFLPPESMVKVRETSPSLKAIVDAVVGEARFTDAYGDRVSENISVGQRLELWANGFIGNAAWPPRTRPETQNQIVQAFDKILGQLNNQERSSWLSASLDYADNATPNLKVDTRGRISIYVQHLRDHHRLVDVNGNVIDTAMPGREIINRMIHGEFDWLPPPPPAPPPPQ
ncbi:F-box protein [Microvirga rosea]|uniref:F-box protein n=1 Tax=Microvirga rosea TaxID=2715425 RepID=UPI001D0A654B|nr:F-box protein [Microvirga rosea]MCB8823516.1 F-box protein [Microvirga rosea]